MARQLRVHPPGGIHHVVARGNGRQPIFVDDDDRTSFLDLLVEARERHRCVLLAYCLMTNHVHLIVQDLDGELSQALRHVIGVHAQRFNRRHGRTGHLFEQRFWNSLIEVDEYLTVAVEYVHRNPLEAGMVDDLAAYEWSSFPAFIGSRRGHPALQPGVVLRQYGNDRRLLQSSTERGLRDPAKEAALRRHRPAPVLGSEAFVASMVGSAPVCAETSASRRRASSGSSLLDRISRLVAQQTGVELAALHRSIRGQHNDQRSLAMYVARQIEGVRLVDIAEHFELSSSAAAMCLTRFEARLAERSDLQELATRVLRVVTAEQVKEWDATPSEGQVKGGMGTPSSRGTPVELSMPDTRR